MKGLTAALLAALIAAPAGAQTVVRRIEISVGGLWAGGTTFPPVVATETGSNGKPFQLFESRSRVGASFGPEASVTVRARRWLQVGVVAAYARPQLSTRLTNDVENAASVNSSETTMRLVVEGCFVAHLTRWSVGSHAIPYVTAGGGYLRELHEGQTIVKTGRAYFGGVGLRFTPGETSAIGVNADVRVVAESGGIALDGRAHVAPAFGASVFVGF